MFAKSMRVEQQDALSVPKIYGNRGIENKKKKEEEFDDVQMHDCDAYNTLRVP